MEKSYNNEIFKTRSGGSVKISDSVRALISSYIVSEKSERSYSTTVNGDAYIGEVIICCTDSGLKDGFNRVVWETPDPNGVRFVYSHQFGSPHSFDSGRIELFTPTIKVGNRVLTLEPDGKIIVPEGMIAVYEWGYDIKQHGHFDNFVAYTSGYSVESTAKFLENGEELKVRRTDQKGYNDKYYLVRNNGGKVLETLHPEQIAAQKKFASDQIDAIVEMGYSQKTAVSVMKTAGPGNCVAAAQWADYATKKISSDLLDCVLKGAQGSNGFGWERMKNAIEALGIKAPTASSSTGFFQILKGAHIAIVFGKLRKEKPVLEEILEEEVY